MELRDGPVHPLAAWNGEAQLLGEEPARPTAGDLSENVWHIGMEGRKKSSIVMGVPQNGWLIIMEISISINGGTPLAGWFISLFIMDNFIEMDDSALPPFIETRK